MKSAIFFHFEVEWEDGNAAKKYGLEKEGGVKETFCWKGVWFLIGGRRGVGNVSNKGRLEKKGAEKIEGGCEPQRNRDNSDTKTNLVLTDLKNGNTLMGYRVTLLTDNNVHHNEHIQLSFVVMFHQSKAKLRSNLFIYKKLEIDWRKLHRTFSGLSEQLTHCSLVLLFYTPWKHQKTFMFSDLFRGYRKATPSCNGLISATWLNEFRTRIFIISITENNTFMHDTLNQKKIESSNFQSLPKLLMG